MNTAMQHAALPTPRSTFVTVLASILLAIGALGVMSSVAQGVWLEASGSQLLATQPAEMQQAGELLTGMFRGVAILNVVLTGLFTFAAYALLRRRNWARRTFVVLFAIALAGNLLAVLVFGVGFGFAGLAASTGPTPLPPETGAFIKAWLVLWAFWAIAASVLFGWLIKRLRSPAIKAEFNGQAGVT